VSIFHNQIYVIMKSKQLSVLLQRLPIYLKINAARNDKSLQGETPVFTEALLNDAIFTARDTTADKVLRDCIYNCKTKRRKHCVTEFLCDT
jgi:hypothetical protein